MNQNLFSSELLSLLNNTNSTFSDEVSLGSNLNNNTKNAINIDDEEEEIGFQDSAEKEFINNIPQLGLYFEPKEKISNNSSIPNDFLQYNFIRVPPIISEEERKSSLSMICDGEIIKISKPQDEKSSADIELHSMERMKNNLYDNFGVENNQRARLVSYQEQKL